MNGLALLTVDFLNWFHNQSEDVASQYQRREFICGFSGSHGKDSDKIIRGSKQSSLG